MARGYYRRGSHSKTGDAVPGMPRGPLYWALREFHDSLDAASRGLSLVDSARAGSGVYVRPGIGCDATVIEESPISPLAPRVKQRVASRCGEKPCAWAHYRLREGGVSVGVRSCADHVVLLIDEDLWVKEIGRYEDFVVFEVMSG